MLAAQMSSSKWIGFLKLGCGSGADQLPVRQRKLSFDIIIQHSLPLQFLKIPPSRPRVDRMRYCEVVKILQETNTTAIKSVGFLLSQHLPSSKSVQYIDDLIVSDINSAYFHHSSIDRRTYKDSTAPYKAHNVQQ